MWPEEELADLAVRLSASGRSEKRKREHRRDREKRVNKQLAVERRRWRERLWRYERRHSLDRLAADQCCEEVARGSPSSGEEMITLPPMHRSADVAQAQVPSQLSGAELLVARCAREGLFTGDELARQESIPHRVA